MIVAALISAVIGGVLAFRCRVLALIPIFALSLLFAGVSALQPQNSPWLVALTVITIILGLQFGYALGIGVRHARLIIRANRIRSGAFADVRARSIR